MTKTGSTFVCQSCGFQSPKWLGRCPSCGEWNSLIEEAAEETAAEFAFPPSEPVLYQDVEEAAKHKIQTGIAELNRVLGGGVVLGSLVLIGGEPGIGKSTLLLQVSRDFAAGGSRVLYVSGEESLEQIKLRGSRLGIGGGDLYLLAETNMERIIAQAEKLAPRILILDSVQTVHSSRLTSSPGSISQVREVANQVFRFAKKNQVSSFLVGHITKEGALAGPKTLEHMVDVVLYFQGEFKSDLRILRAEKNRFGPVNEQGIFQMTGKGLTSIKDPSQLFLQHHSVAESGISIFPAMNGLRPILIEIQALVTESPFSGNPRRISVGFDNYRMSMLISVIEKKLKLPFYKSDVFLNVTGGMSIRETAGDLSVLSALISSYKNITVPQDIVIIGEVGLTGEVRSVGFIDNRIKEAIRQGFKQFILPASQSSLTHIKNISIISVANIFDFYNHINTKK